VFLLAEILARAIEKRKPSLACQTSEARSRQSRKASALVDQHPHNEPTMFLHQVADPRYPGMRIVLDQVLIQAAKCAGMTVRRKFKLWPSTTWALVLSFPVFPEVAIVPLQIASADAAPDKSAFGQHLLSASGAKAALHEIVYCRVLVSPHASEYIPPKSVGNEIDRAGGRL
jgi:hypothetical protein